MHLARIAAVWRAREPGGQERLGPTPAKPPAPAAATAKPAKPAKTVNKPQAAANR